MLLACSLSRDGWASDHPRLLSPVSTTAGKARRKIASGRLESGSNPWLSTPVSRRALRAKASKKRDAAAYCSLSISRFDAWMESGQSPKPIAGICRWDLKAIDAALGLPGGVDRDRSRMQLINGTAGMRVVHGGIHTVKRRLASGEVNVHYDAWRCGPESMLRAFPTSSRSACRGPPASAEFSLWARCLIQAFARVQPPVACEQTSLSRLHQRD